MKGNKKSNCTIIYKLFVCRKGTYERNRRVTIKLK